MFSKFMKKREQQSFLISLSGSRGGRVLLHLGALLRSWRNWGWHSRFIVQNVMPASPRQGDPGDGSPAGRHS